MIRKLVRIRVGNDQVDRPMDALADSTEKALVGALGTDNQVNNKLIGVTATQVFHGLGQKPLGRIIVAQDADARIWDGISANPAIYWVFIASSPVTINVLFY